MIACTNFKGGWFYIIPEMDNVEIKELLNSIYGVHNSDSEPITYLDTNSVDRGDNK